MISRRAVVYRARRVGVHQHERQRTTQHHRGPAVPDVGFLVSTGTVVDVCPSAATMPLNGVEACSLLDASSLPVAWQPLKTNPAPILQLGDSDCSISNLETSIGVDIVLYRGPGTGIDSLSKTTASTPPPSTSADVVPA